MGIFTRLFGTSAPPTPPTPRFTLDVEQRDFTEQLEDVPKFFKDFRSKCTLPKRDQFETDDEYAQRLPAPLDQRQRVYFRFGSRSRNSSSYHYDIATQILSVDSNSSIYPKFQEDGKTKVEIGSSYDHLNNYKAQNKFGAQYSITESRWTDYSLRLNGTVTDFAPLLRAKPLYEHDPTAPEKTFDFRISLLIDRDLAREQAAKLSLVLGVNLISWEHASFNDYSDDHDLTMESPDIEHKSHYIIDAIFSSLHLVNCETNTQFAVYR